MGNTLILALFPDEAAADNAVVEIKQWDKASDEIKLGAIGVLVKDEKGKIKTHKLGARHTGAGAVLFGLTALVTGGAAIGLGLVGGSILGAGVGSLFRKGLSMSEQDVDRLNQELDGGKAAVGFMVEGAGAEIASAKLAELGGQPMQYEVAAEAVAQAQEAAAAAPEAPAAPETDAAGSAHAA